ncbi:MAG: hypothetical protein HQK74_01875 [Desulfamplus sp.]|nr:hypothetical protein [Desulfamplus sp.]
MQQEEWEYSQNIEDGQSYEQIIEEQRERIVKEQDKTGIRYKMTHLGDIVVDAFDRLWSSASSSTKGISLTYNIHELKKRKRKLHRKIGERVSKIKEQSPLLEIFDDEVLLNLFSDLAKIEKNINASIYEREERLYPKRAMKEQCV